MCSGDVSPVRRSILQTLVRRHDQFGRLIRWEVFPDPQRDEPVLDELTIGVTVPIAVPSHLVEPEVGSSLRGDEVFRAAVPEAPVDEDIEANAAEHDVGSTTAVEGQRHVHPVAQSGPVEKSANCELGASVRASVTLHRAPSGGGDRRLNCRWRQIACGRHTFSTRVRPPRAWHAVNTRRLTR